MGKKGVADATGNAAGEAIVRRDQERKAAMDADDDIKREEAAAVAVAMA